ncbi:MAG: discoidin domain-containing protein [Chitinophagales bacterium]
MMYKTGFSETHMPSINEFSFSMFTTFFIVFFMLFSEPLKAQDNFVYGTLTFNCDEGFWGTSTGCYLRIYYQNEGGLSLEQARERCAVNDWVLASPQEIQEAWDRKLLDVYAFGMMEDGRLAVPVQTDHPTISKGTNIGIQGQSQGFFYALASAAKRSYPKPAVATKTETVQSSDGPVTFVLPAEASLQIWYQANNVEMEFSEDEVVDFMKVHYKYTNGLGNIIQDKWGHPDYSPILDGALKRYIAEKFPYRASDDAYLYNYIKHLIQDKEPECASCLSTRYEYIGFFVGEYLNALRLKSNPKLNQQFSEYAGYRQAWASRKTLEAWANYSRKFDVVGELAVPHDPGTPRYVNYGDLQPVRYKPNTLSILTESAVPLPGKSIDEFNQQNGGSPFYLSENQEIMLRDLFVPMGAQEAATRAFGEVNGEILQIPNYLGENLSWQSQLISQAGGVGIGAIPMAAVGLSVSAWSSAIAAKAGIVVTEVVKETVQFGTQFVVKEIPTQVVRDVTSLFSKELGSKALGPMLSNAVGPILIGVAVFAAGFQNTGGKAIAIAVFEDNLRRDCVYRPYQIDWHTASGGDQATAFAWLFKMIVLDAPGLTIAIPKEKANTLQQSFTERAALLWGIGQDPSKEPEYEKVMATIYERYLNRNLAEGRPARQSSVYENKDANRAVDGNYDGNYHNQSVTHTHYDREAWWEVDLGVVCDITAIKIFPRTDFAPERLNGFNIIVSETPIENNYPHREKMFAINEPLTSVDAKTIKGAKRGRYVRIFLSGTNYLSLAEVEVIGTPLPVASWFTLTNNNPVELISVGKTARQSSVYEAKDANRAVDGNTDGNFWNQSVTHTNYENDPWMEIDLGQNYDITQIVVYPRTDCCPDRIDGFNILISDEPFTNNTGGRAFATDYPLKTVNPVTVEGNQSGRYVRFYLKGPKYLSLAELEVYGRKQ